MKEGNVIIDRNCCLEKFAYTLVLSLGSNMGPSAEILQSAVDALSTTPHFALTACSSVYLTKPVGDVEQDDFYNIVLIIRTDLEVHAVLERCQAIENSFGRVRDPQRPHGPRTLDIDLIYSDGMMYEDEKLTLPHPRAHERAFVLVPWQEINPQARLPQGRISDLLSCLDSADVRPANFSIIWTQSLEN